MMRGHEHPTEAEHAISNELQSFQRRAAAMWHGREKEAIIAVIRALDSIAVARMFRLATIAWKKEHEKTLTSSPR